MAKVINPLMSMSASGQFAKSMVFQKNNTVREYVIPANPQSVAQMLVRHNLADIQATLKTLGAVLRGELKAGFGPRWNSMIIKEITNNAAAYLADVTVTYNAFQAGEKTAWDTANTAPVTTMAKGLAMYATAKAVSEIAARLGVSLDLTPPTNANAATVAAEWITD